MTVNEAITGRVTGTATRRRNGEVPEAVELGRVAQVAGMPRKPWRIRKVPNAVARNGSGQARVGVEPARGRGSSGRWGSG